MSQSYTLPLESGWCSLVSGRPSSLEKLTVRCPSFFFYKERTVWRGPSVKRIRFWNRTATWQHNHDTRHYNYHGNVLRCERSILGTLEKKSKVRSDQIRRHYFYNSSIFVYFKCHNPDRNLSDCVSTSLTMARSSQQAAHVQDAACGFRMRSCNTHTSLHL